jgi:hypothetical protein
MLRGNPELSSDGVMAGGFLHPGPGTLSPSKYHCLRETNGSDSGFVPFARNFRVERNSDAGREALDVPLVRIIPAKRRSTWNGSSRGHRKKLWNGWRRSKKFCVDAKFWAEDGNRSDRDSLCSVFAAFNKAGETAVNIPEARQKLHRWGARRGNGLHLPPWSRRREACRSQLPLIIESARPAGSCLGRGISTRRI